MAVAEGGAVAAVVEVAGAVPACPVGDGDSGVSVALTSVGLWLAVGVGLRLVDGCVLEAVGVALAEIAPGVALAGSRGDGLAPTAARHSAAGPVSQAGRTSRSGSSGSVTHWTQTLAGVPIAPSRTYMSTTGPHGALPRAKPMSPDPARWPGPAIAAETRRHRGEPIWLSRYAGGQAPAHSSENLPLPLASSNRVRSPRPSDSRAPPGSTGGAASSSINR